MAEYGYNEYQIIQPGSSAILNNIRPCTHRPRLVAHEDGASNILLSGWVSNGCCPKPKYKVDYSCNICIPEGGTPGEIQVALTFGGEIIPLTIAAATPAGAEQFWHVSGTKTIELPFNFCGTVTVANASVSATPATVPAPAIGMRNLNVTVERTA